MNRNTHALPAIVLMAIFLIGMIAGATVAPPVSPTEQGSPAVSHWPVDPGPVTVVPISWLGGFIVGEPGDWVFVEMDGLEQATQSPGECQLVQVFLDCEVGPQTRWMNRESFLAMAACMEAGWEMCSPYYGFEFGLTPPFSPCMTDGCEVGEASWFELDIVPCYAINAPTHDCDWVEFSEEDCHPTCVP